jgi:uncharacterized protein (TIGR03085 family)
VSPLAATERTLLCTLAEQLGPDAPTLCDGWAVKDLVVHLLVREGSPAGLAVAVPPLAGALAKATERQGRADLGELVHKLRQGPPFWSPFALPKVGAMLNGLEFFVHHEDIRRAQPGWEPRTLPAEVEDRLWRAVRLSGRGLVAKAKAGVGVAVERSDTGDRARLQRGDGEVVVRGMPSELVMFLFGRTGHAGVELLGEPDDVASLEASSLGV